ncbi:MAG: SDR family NAD(P)-dependent oxidoreductase [Alphaproteobacteria bacterium]
METNLKERVALVTGGSRGVGKAICLELAERGADVAFIYRSATDLAQVTVEEISAFGVKALPVQVDITDATATATAITSVVERFGGIDILAHAAGGRVSWAPIREIDPTAWARHNDVDLNGSFNVISAVVRHMHERHSGVIVAISSIAAQMCQSRNANAAAAKAGLEALIRVLAREEGRHGIRANVVAIGLTGGTDQAQIALDNWGPEVTKRVISSIPLGRVGDVKDVAHMVAFLASDEGDYITGKVYQVDGGQIIVG